MPPRSTPIWSLPTAPRFLRHIPPPRVRKSQDHGGLAAMSTAEFFSIHPTATTTTTSGWTSSSHRPTRAAAGVSSIRCSTEAGGQGHRAAVVSGEKLLRDGNLMKCGGGCIVEVLTLLPNHQTALCAAGNGNGAMKCYRDQNVMS